MSSMFGGKSKTSSTSTQSVDVPSWALGPLQQAMSMAQTASSNPYEAYTDPRFAGFTQDELNSFQGVRNVQGQYQPAFAQANDIMNTVAQSGLEGFSQDYLNQYMNPYMTNVLDVQRNRSIDNYDQQMIDYRGRAGQAAAFGGSRFGLGEAQMQKNFQRQLGEQEALGLASAYEQAQGAAERGMARAGQAGLSMADLATTGQGLAYQDYSALNAQGGQQRALDQAGLDFNYEQWLMEQQHPYTQAEFLAGIASPIAGQVSGSTTNTTQTQKDGQGWLQKAVGLASMAAAPFTGGASMLGGLGSLASSFSQGLGSLGMQMGGLGGAVGNFLNPAYVGNLGNDSNYNRYMQATQGLAKGGVVGDTSEETIAFPDGEGGLNEYVINEIIRQYLANRDKGSPSVKNSGQSGNPTIPWFRALVEEEIPAMYGPGYAEGGPVRKGNWLTDSKFSPIYWGNELAEYALDNPVDAAATALMAAGPVGWGAKAGLGAIKAGLGKGAVKGAGSLISKYPGVAAFGAGLGLKGLSSSDEKASEESPLEFDPKDEKDIYELQQHIANLAGSKTGQQMGRYSPDVAEDKGGKYSRLYEKYPQLDPLNTSHKPENTWIGQAMGLQDVDPEVSETPQTVADQAASAVSATQNGLAGVATKSEPEGSKFNMPLFMFGAKMLQSQGDFFQAMGEGGEAFGAVKASQETEAAKAARQRFEDSIETYKLEQQDRKISNNEKWMQIQAAQASNPYSQQLKQLKVMEMMQKLSQDPNAKMKLDAWKAMQSNPLMMNTPEGQNLNQEVMQMLSASSGAASGAPGLPPGYELE